MDDEYDMDWIRTARSKTIKIDDEYDIDTMGSQDIRAGSSPNLAV